LEQHDKGWLAAAVNDPASTQPGRRDVAVALSPALREELGLTAVASAGLFSLGPDS
jgi:hypothetical protein